MPEAPFLGRALGLAQQFDIRDQRPPVCVAQAGSGTPARDLVVLRSRRQPGQRTISARQPVTRHPQRDVSLGEQFLLFAERVFVANLSPQSPGEGGVPVREAFQGVHELLPRGIAVARDMHAKEAFRVVLRGYPTRRFGNMLLVDRAPQPACQRELTRLDREIEALAVFGIADFVVVSDPLEHRIALVDLAFADQP